MSKKIDAVNSSPLTNAPLTNVVLLLELVDRLLKRGPGLPGLATFSGPSGYGKSVAAAYAGNTHRCFHVQLGSRWTAKYLMQKLCVEIGVDEPGRTIPEMIDQVGDELARSRRPLIIDEADFLVGRKMIEIVRDLWERSQSPIILIGEETLPATLQRWERIAARMLDWVNAQPATLDDVAHLVKLRCPGIRLDPALVEKIHKAAAGSTRRVVVNLDRVRNVCEADNLKSMALEEWGDRPFFVAYRRAA